MGKAIGFALALMLTVPLLAAAEQMQGTIKTVNSVDHSFVFFENGTKFWANGHLDGLERGDQVLAGYETQGDKKMVTYIAYPSSGPNGQMIPHFGAQAGD